MASRSSRCSSGADIILLCALSLSLLMCMRSTMVDQLVTHERIRTTLPKAKELRRVADQVVTLAKQGDEPARKRAQAIMRTPEAVEKLFDVFAPRYKYVSRSRSLLAHLCGSRIQSPTSLLHSLSRSVERARAATRAS